jgi:hypothetical protein
MFAPAFAGGVARPPHDSGHLLYVDALVHFGCIRPGLLHGPRGARVVYGVRVFSGRRRCELRHVHTWLPEQYPTECRASAFAFTTSVGRFVGAGVTFLVGAGVRHFETLGVPVALTACAFVPGLLLLPFGEDTKGKPLPG